MVNSCETRNLEGCHSREGLVLLQLLSRDLFSPAPCSLALSACEEPVTNLLPVGCCAVDASPSHIPGAALMVTPRRRDTSASGLTFPSTRARQPPPASLSTGEIALDNILMSWWNSAQRVSRFGRGWVAGLGWRCRSGDALAYHRKAFWVSEEISLQVSHNFSQQISSW